MGKFKGSHLAAWPAPQPLPSPPLQHPGSWTTALCCPLLGPCCHSREFSNGDQESLFPNFFRVPLSSRKVQNEKRAPRNQLWFLPVTYPTLKQLSNLLILLPECVSELPICPKLHCPSVAPSTLSGPEHCNDPLTDLLTTALVLLPPSSTKQPEWRCCALGNGDMAFPYSKSILIFPLYSGQNQAFLTKSGLYFQRHLTSFCPVFTGSPHWSFF